MTRRTLAAAVIAPLAAVAVGATVWAQTSRDAAPSFKTGPGTVPDEIKLIALAELADTSEGSRPEVYGEGAGSLADVMKVEPIRNTGRELPSEDYVAYAVFVTGDFTIRPPIPDPDPEVADVVRLSSARVVVGEDGTVLDVSMWPERIHPSPPFGERFDST